ncbi:MULTISPECIES: GAF domain-containing protein [unclassified Streptomyces]|uniref:GAF domain-containing protein n=1 Tax=unclassified Streptomyces TaxID=2593676 RepID=UPI00087A9856|nr:MULTISPECIES: GAF domain-containing protein [unclassified Streptomyces]REH20659.1 GAF domain-containing protein [Streptomyces sp. 2221.1]SDT31555.1 GAF domain-containing protein [Streptomyces sp. 2114.2]
MTHQPLLLAQNNAHTLSPLTATEPLPQLLAADGTPLAGPLVPDPAEQAERIDLIRRLGLPTSANPDFDAIATDMAHAAAFLYGFINLFLNDQTFVGLHQPPPGSGHVVINRTMRLDHGWCPEVVARKRPLPLRNVHASPRFSGNPVVDAVGITSYFGVPLIHPSGVTLGTVCVTDPDERPLNQAVVIRDKVVAYGQRVMDHITRNYRL